MTESDEERRRLAKALIEECTIVIDGIPYPIPDWSSDLPIEDPRHPDHQDHLDYMAWGSDPKNPHGWNYNPN